MTSADLLIRPAVVGDAGAIAGVYEAARAAAPMPAAGLGDTSWMRAKAREAEASAGDSRELPDTWVAESAGRVAGYARVVGDWLDDLYVHPSHARQGIGTALLDLVKGLRPGGFGLWVYRSNEPARRFYAVGGVLELYAVAEPAGDLPELRLAWPGIDPVAHLRGLVDEIDDELGTVLQRRARLTALIQQYKPVGGDPGRDPDRERRIAERLAARAPSLGPERVRRIVQAIVTESLAAADDE